jgi:hypothetical protein
VTTARSHLIDPTRTGCYHLVSRCVRRAFLCGREHDHRRQWIEDALREQASLFAIEILAYAVMSNHLHLVVKVHPQRAGAWTALEVAERWTALFPLRGDDGAPIAPEKRYLDALSLNEAWVAERRSRLASISWLMKVIKERIARRANAEDGCTGHFWEGRFQSVALLDQAAVIACRASVDLNPIRARRCDRPERSARTSVHERIRQRSNQRAGVPVATRPIVASLDRCTPWSDEFARLVARPISTDDYLELVDQTGRIVRGDKKGGIPLVLAPILRRLDLDLDGWLSAMASGGRFTGSAVGTLKSRASEAAVRGARWLADKTGLFRESADVA